VKRITEEILAQARFMAGRGESWSAIAKTLGVKRQGLRRSIARGIMKKTETAAARRRCVKRARKGETLATIAKAERLTIAQVRYALRGDA